MGSDRECPAGHACDRKDTEGDLAYCQDNQEVAAAGWEAMFSGYVEDVEAAAEKQRREKAGWDLIWDGLQIVAGAVVTAVGLGWTPFTGGISLGLAVLGGSLVVGGINNAINHYSIATTGQEFNVMDMADRWVDVNVAQPIASFGPVGQFLGGVVSGAGHVVTGMGQLSVKDVAVGDTEAPRVDIHVKWTQYALWLFGGYGFSNLGGHEIGGRSPELVHDLCSLSEFGNAHPNDGYFPREHIPTDLLFGRVCSG